MPERIRSAARPHYHGRLQAVILDWAGTTVDFGCQAPVVVLLEIFAARGVPISIAEARQSMGLLKKDQIRAICSTPEVQERWRRRYGSAPAEKEVEALFADFIPRQLSCLAMHSDLVPGAAEAVARLRERGLKIGSTTGYTRPMLQMLLDCAGAQGYRPDSAVCPDDVGAGRPLPWMCYQNAINLKAYPLEACVKIGDTVSDIQEGLNAGMWTIAVAATGNEVGLTEQEFNALDAHDQESRTRQARERLAGAGAHYVTDSIANCDDVLDDIEARLRVGETP
jgi:phosphonoacetaldehyde hydrolase